MRKLHNEFPNIQIVHRSFALAWESEELALQFGSLQNAKTEILQH